MAHPPLHPELQADRTADRRTWLFFGVFLICSCIVEASSDHAEHVWSGNSDWRGPWLWQATSHVVIFMVAPIIPFMLSRFPITRRAWPRAVPAHFAASLVFSASHILLMVALRVWLSPILAGYEYDYDLGAFSVWLYEYRKDLLTYILLVMIFDLSRQVEQRTLELTAARTEARERHRLTLKSGGRTFLIDAHDVIWAKAASNYVEVVTPQKIYLARLTLTELERLLASAGDQYVRVHRSYLVNFDHVREILPTGQGDVVLHLASGDEVPGSRRYRRAFENKTLA